MVASGVMERPARPDAVKEDSWLRIAVQDNAVEVLALDPAPPPCPCALDHNHEDERNKAEGDGNNDDGVHGFRCR